ncbi:hypothetical protein DW322_20615 [Rhodococcus rhodnii]|nr:hypothetical protein DW322_20615 [Rhodococcus rhodnii]
MDGFLRIYMNDQLALGVAWRELARRTRDQNTGTALGEALDEVATGIAEDVETFRSVMRELSIRADPLEPALTTVAERIGRWKPHGRLRGYSPLSRFEELEFLVMGLETKKQLWTTMRDLAGLGERLSTADFDELIERAERQRERIEPFRVEAGTEAFRGSSR